MNGDGFQDIIFGARYDDANGCTPYTDGYDFCSGAAYIQLGPISGDVDLTATATKLLGPDSAEAGIAVSSAGDVDGDGLAEVLVGGTGVVWVVDPPVGGTMELSDAETSIATNIDRDGYPQYAVAPIGDFYGDGTDDILVGRYADKVVFADTSSSTFAFVISDPMGASGLADASLALTSSATPMDYDAVAATGDVNQDGNPDLLVSCHSCGKTLLFQGLDWLVYGPREGTLDLDDADVLFMGVEEIEEAGLTIAGAGDTDADGFMDILIAGPGSGTAYLVSGAALPE